MIPCPAENLPGLVHHPSSDENTNKSPQTCSYFDQQTHNYLKVTYSYPRVTYSDHRVTYSDPKVTYIDPMHLPLPPPTPPEPHLAIS